MAAPIKNAAHVDQRAQTRLGLGAALIPLFFAVGFARVHHRQLPQAASERHRVRRRRAAGSDRAAGHPPPAGGRLGVRHLPGRHRRRSGARRQPARPQCRLRSDHGPEAARDRDRRQRQRPNRRDGGRDPGAQRNRGPGCATRRRRGSSARFGGRARPRRSSCSSSSARSAATSPRPSSRRSPPPCCRTAATRSSPRPPSWSRRSST